MLVNGKRRHRAAVIQWTGSGRRRLARPRRVVILSIALRQVKVLRDGASAQYGSDAIEGVLNFLLKDDRQGGSIEVGAAVTRKAMERPSRPPATRRSVQRDDVALLIATGNTHVRDPAQIWG